MKTLYYKAIIEDIRHERCTESEINTLLDVYNNTIRRMASTLAATATYQLSDFYNAQKRGIAGFTLTIERKKLHGQDQWHGQFCKGQKNLHVIATLEDTDKRHKRPIVQDK